MRKRVSVFGLGYVGSVTAGCLAHRGHEVHGVDINPAKVASLNSGKSPVLEPRLDELISEGIEGKRIRATTDTTEAVSESEVSFICVGTPSLPNGKLDASVVEHVCEQIGEALRHKADKHLVVLRSTMLPGTAENVALPAIEKTSGKLATEGFEVLSNPEFLREGSAVADFLEPPMTVIGGQNADATRSLRELYEGTPGDIFETSLATAEMIKYSCNCFHALKVAFANEFGALCKRLGVDAEEMTNVFLADDRLNISPAYLRPGFAFGGSCLPKDLRALTYRAKELDVGLPLLNAILPSNEEHIDRAVDLILGRKRRDIALLGLSFKPGTDDLRESPHVQLAKRLLGEGCNLRIWDPNVSLGRLIGSNRAFIEEYIPHIGSLLRDDLTEVIDGAAVIVLGTTGIDKDTLLEHVSEDQAVIDLVNLSKADRPATGGYEGICW